MGVAITLKDRDKIYKEETFINYKSKLLRLSVPLSLKIDEPCYKLIQ